MNVRHGLTSRVSSQKRYLRKKLADVFSEGSANPDVLQVAERLADLQAQMVSIRLEKAAVIGRAVSQVPRHSAIANVDIGAVGRGDSSEDNSAFDGNEDFFEAQAIAINLNKLKTLDGYEVRALSRMRKARYALLLALERAGWGQHNAQS